MSTNNSWNSSDPVDVNDGGTGLSTITDNSVILGSGTGAVTPIAVGTDGQLLVGSTSADCVFATVSSSDSTIAFTTGAGTLSIQGAAATDSQAGVIELATDAETNTGTATDRALTPANITAWTGDTALVTTGTITTGTWSATDVAAVAGGTGRSSHTAYAVICGGTTTTAAQQSIASVGTSGQILTSNGAAALPTFQAPAAGGSWTLLTSTAISTDAFIAFNATYITDTYDIYALGFQGIDPENDGVNLQFQVSNDNASTWEATGYQGSAMVTIYGAASVGERNVTTGCLLTDTINTWGNANEELSGMVYIYNPTTSGLKTGLSGNILYKTGAGTTAYCVPGGNYNTAEDDDAIRIIASAGDLISGTVSLWGLTNT